MSDGRVKVEVIDVSASRGWRGLGFGASRGHGPIGGSRCWLLIGARVGGMGDGRI